MNKQFTKLVRPFLLLWLFTAIGIFLHELAHHLVGVSSMMSFSRNWPLEAVTTENIGTAIPGSLAGPIINLIFSYIALSFYRYYKKNKRIRFYWMLWGLANSFLVFSAAIINLTVDMISGTKGNDLQVVSRLWNINIFIPFKGAETVNISFACFLNKKKFVLSN